MESGKNIDEIKQQETVSRKHSGRTVSESVHILITDRDEEDLTHCGDGGYCFVWGNIWVSIATPIIIIALVCLVVWAVKSYMDQ